MGTGSQSKLARNLPQASAAANRRTTNAEILLDTATPPELRFAFSQLPELFQGQSSKSEVLAELFWATLHGIAELTRTKRFPRSRQKERVRALVELFTFPRDATVQVVKVR